MPSGPIKANMYVFIPGVAIGICHAPVHASVRSSVVAMASD
jgi:hypothetical protein